MSLDHVRSRRRFTGGRIRVNKKKKLFELGSDPMLTKLGGRQVLNQRTIGGNLKLRLFSSDVANVFDPKSKKYQKLKIITIKENGANRNFVRRNIMTKGCIIETEQGKARVTSRPGQEGTINAILI
jgi:small subunit ribosomal protein S8e